VKNAFKMDKMGDGMELSRRQIPSLKRYVWQRW
jgi:hypothetical protein